MDRSVVERIGCKGKSGKGKEIASVAFVKIQ